MSPFQPVVDAFNADDDRARIELLNGCLASDAEVVHIHGVSTSPGAFSTAIGDIRGALGGLHARVTGSAQSLHGWAYQRWEIVDGDGVVFASGTYVAKTSGDGRFTTLLSLPDSHG